MDLSKVTRFELIDYTTGEQPDRYTRLGVSAELSLQDHGRTLKVFLTDSPVPAAEVNAQIREGLAAALEDPPD